MSTLEALNAISEAIQAHAKLPEVEKSLKEAREAHDYVQLELEEAKAQIEALKTKCEYWEEMTSQANETIREHENKIEELTDRNNGLHNSLSDVTRLYNDAQSTISERNLQIDSLRFTVDSLQSRLEESKSYGTKLAETLKSIGASIVAAVEVPEVTPSAPFPVSDSVGLPTAPNFEVGVGDGYGISNPVAEPTVSTVGPMITASEVEECLTETAPGTNVYKYW
jgi:peptidoglycan hydrolase CwlO-like protein